MDPETSYPINTYDIVGFIFIALVCLGFLSAIFYGSCDTPNKLTVPQQEFKEKLLQSVERGDILETESGLYLIRRKPVESKTELGEICLFVFARGKEWCGKIDSFVQTEAAFKRTLTKDHPDYCTIIQEYALR